MFHGQEQPRANFGATSTILKGAREEASVASLIAKGEGAIMADISTTNTTGRYGTADGAHASGDDEEHLLQRRGVVEGVEGKLQKRGERVHGVGMTTEPSVRLGMRYAMFGIVVVGCVMAAFATHAYTTYWTQADMQVRNIFHDCLNDTFFL